MPYGEIKVKYLDNLEKISNITTLIIFKRRIVTSYLFHIKYIDAILKKNNEEKMKMIVYIWYSF